MFLQTFCFLWFGVCLLRWTKERLLFITQAERRQQKALEA